METITECCEVGESLVRFRIKNNLPQLNWNQATEFVKIQMGDQTMTIIDNTTESFMFWQGILYV